MKHTQESALRTLGQKNDLRIRGSKILILTDRVWDNKKGEYVDNPRKKHDIGNKSWGKIDFLTKYYGYSIVNVDKF